MALSHRSPVKPCAMYLRCYPQDIWEMQTHQQVLRVYAAHLGLPEPVLFLDNGISSNEAAPQREALADAVAGGFFRYILIPGPWVFHLDHSKAHRIAHSLTAAGGQVLDLPAHGHYTKDGVLSYERIPGLVKHLPTAVG